MEFTVTEEFVREAHGAACSTWKQRIEKEFPDLFKTEFEVGKWYKHKETDALICYQDGKCSYGLSNDGCWTNGYQASIPMYWKEATHEEVKSALEKEIIKRFGKDWKNAKIKECLWHGESDTNCGFNAPIVLTSDNLAWSRNGCILKDGIFAEPLIEKTIITKGKALRIIAKKLKVSPESIEIQ